MERGFGYATLLRVGEIVLAMKTDGTLVAFAASTERYQELASAELFTTTTRALPALSDGRLYARDTQQLKCLHLRDGS